MYKLFHWESNEYIHSLRKGIEQQSFFYILNICFMAFLLHGWYKVCSEYFCLKKINNKMIMSVTNAFMFSNLANIKFSKCIQINDSTIKLQKRLYRTSPISIYIYIGNIKNNYIITYISTYICIYKHRILRLNRHADSLWEKYIFLYF